MLSPIALVVLAATTLSIAAPVSDSQSTAAVFKRADIKPVSCGPDGDQRAWTQQALQGALDGLVTYMNEPNSKKPKGDSGTGGTEVEPLKAKGYPGNFTPDLATKEVQDAINAMPECATGQADKSYFEFPITDPAFNGGDPGPDRLIAIAEGTKPDLKNAVYCLSLTHREAATKNAFNLCTNA